jgi:hypothetical protein
MQLDWYSYCEKRLYIFFATLFCGTFLGEQKSSKIKNRTTKHNSTSNHKKKTQKKVCRVVSLSSGELAEPTYPKQTA